MAEDKLKRKVQFYRLTTNDLNGTLPSQQWGKHLETVTAHEFAGTAHHHADDGMVLLGRVVRNDNTKAMALYVVRYADLPARERAGKVSDLRLRPDEGLAEPIHVVFVPRNVVGLLYNHYGPRANRLAEFLNEKCGIDVRVEPVIRSDVLAVLERLTSLRKVHLRLNEGHMESLRADENFYEAIKDVNGPGGGTVALGWTFDPDKREAATTVWKRRLRTLLTSPARRAIEKAEVRGRDPESGRLETVDLLSDRIVVEREVVRASDRVRLIDDGSAVAAILDAYQLAEGEIRASIDGEGNGT